MGFTDFFYKDISTNLISFSSRYTFPLNLLVKPSVAWVKNYEFLNYFLCGQPYWIRDISKTSELKFVTKTFSAGTWFIHFDGPCNYLDSFQKYPAVSLKINATFLIRNTLAIVITNLLKQDLSFSSNTFLRPFNADFAAAKASLVIISSSGNSISGDGSGNGIDSTNTCGSTSSKIFSLTGKYKLGVIAGVRVDKYS